MKHIQTYTLILLITGVIFTQSLKAQNTKSNFSLEEAIEFALENNFNVKNANLDIEKAKQKVWETTATGLPQISANVDYDYYIQQPLSILPDFITPSVIATNQQLGLIDEQQASEAFQSLVGSPQAVTFGTKHNFTAGVTLNQLIFSGSYLVGLQSAKAYKKISELTKEKTELAIKEATINAYTSVLVADEYIKILEKNLTVSERSLFEITEIYKQGLTEEQNVDQLSYTNQQIKTSLSIAKRQKTIALNTLKYIMGIAQEDNLTLTSTTQDLVATSLQLLNKNNLTVQEHIDYKLANNNLVTSELQVKYQKSMALPTLSAFLSHSYSENGNEFVFFNDDKTDFQTTLLGVRMSIPIFSSFAKRSKTQQAQINQEQAQTNLNKVTEELKKQINQSRLEYENALDTYQNSQELIKLSQSIYNKEKVKFIEGLSTSTELTTAENQLYQSQNQYIQAILQVITAKTTFEQALGQL